jgi:Flp pilus assembly pilin Flp
MMGLLRNKKGQNTAEYAILIALVVAAAIAMQTYVKRSLQGGIKYVVDKSGKTSGTTQYEPYYLESKYTSTVNAYKDTEEAKTGGAVERQFGVGADKQTTRSGYQKLHSALEQD